MNKLVVRPRWTPEDNGGWYDTIGVGKLITEYFYKQFEKYGAIREFEAYTDSMVSELSVYYIITYEDSEVVTKILERRHLVDYYIDFLTFDLYADVYPYESLGSQNLHDDFPLYYYNHSG